MNLYRYDVSLRIRHPNMDVGLISKKLGLKPWITNQAGSQRRTPKGNLLDGIYESTYCSFRLEHSRDISLVDFLKECNERFNMYSDFLKEINASGGSVEYFIGWYCETDGNVGEAFDLELLTQLVALGIELDIDFYR